MEATFRISLLIGITCLVRHTVGLAISKEVCIQQTFKANCSAGSVITIQSALYGRMRSSRCLRNNNTDLNCYANVQHYLESMCNDRAECSIAGSDDKLTDAFRGRCLKGLTPYLEVNYTCTQDIECDDYDPPEDVTVENITSGHRISCISDRNISWEVHCVNEAWIPDDPRRCPTASYTIETSSVTLKVHKDIPCVDFIPPENAAAETIVSGHRLSCRNDRGISWEVHCVNGTWISDTSRSCTSVLTGKPTSNHPVAATSVASENQDVVTGQPSLEMNMMIIALCATVAMIIVSGNHVVQMSTEKSTIK